MARAGRKRKDGPRYACGKLKKPPIPRDQRKSRKGQRRKLRAGDVLFEGQIVSWRRGYPVVQREGRVHMIHILVWEAANGPRPEGMHIHHKNGDTYDYSLENLELLSPEDHSRTHAGWTKTDGVWTHKPCRTCGKQLPFKEFSPSNGGYQSRCRPCRSEYVWALEKANRAKRQQTQNVGEYHGQS